MGQVTFSGASIERSATFTKRTSNPDEALVSAFGVADLSRTAAGLQAVIVSFRKGPVRRGHGPCAFSGGFAILHNVLGVGAGTHPGWGTPVIIGAPPNPRRKGEKVVGGSVSRTAGTGKFRVISRRAGCSGPQLGKRRTATRFP